MHKVTIKSIIDSNDISKLKNLAYETIDILDCLEELDEESYAKHELNIYEIQNGKKISEEIAIDWVENMKPYGMKWTLEETTRAMRDKNWNLDPIDFFVVANMMFNDYNDIVLDDVDLALNMAKDWLKDTDVKENKLYNYYKYVV